MGNAQWVLEFALLVLLAATLFHALRLERALGVLKRDRAVLEELVAGFNDSTRQAESGIERLRAAADGAGRQMVRQIEAAQKLHDDLRFLADRSDRLAERLESAVRSARMFADSLPLQNSPGPTLQVSSRVPPAVTFRSPEPALHSEPSDGSPTDSQELEEAGGPRLRSQAERDLLRALRMGRR